MATLVTDPRGLHGVTEPEGRCAHAGHQAPVGFVRRYVFSTDHKVIGIQFLFFGLAFFLVGGVLALIVRWQLAWPNPQVDGFRPLPVIARWLGWPGGVMPPEFYNMAFSMHATIMIFLVIIPLLVGAFGNYLIPLKIGARDMAFPLLNGLSLWWALPGAAILLVGFTGAAAGWTSYPPLTGAPGLSRIYEPWPPVVQAAVWAAFFLLGLFVATHTFRGPALVRMAAGVLVAAAAATVATPIARRLAPTGQAAWFLGILWLGFGSVMAAVNYITTIVKLRCPGLTMFRLPLSVWSLLVTALIVLMATPVLAAALTLNLLDHHGFTSFFQPTGWTISGQLQPNAGGGQALVHQHLFWFYSHPAVYIMVLPAMGMVSDVLAVFSRKPVFGYRPMVYAMAAIAVLGFLVWAHHMFQSGMNPTLGTAFAVSTMLIAVPSGVKTFNWLGTLWGGTIRFTAAMLCAVAFVALFVVGGLSGIFLASQAVDVHLHDTYFVVAHIHYVLFGGTTFGIFAAVYFWYPKMFGRMMSERLGKLHAWLSFVAFNLVFFPMHILGVRGFPRRYADYTGFDQWADLVPMNQFITYAAIGLGLAQVPLAVNFLGSMVWGRRAPDNPWDATTLEWATPSPPPHGNFDRTPVVYHGPYEYSSPLVEEDWLAQTRRVEKRTRD